MKLYAGGLAVDGTNAQLMQEFSAYGRVSSAEMVIDRCSGTPHGCGFVEMPSKNEAIAAISVSKGLNGQSPEVNAARPPARRPHGRDQGGGGRRGGRDHRVGDRRGVSDRRPGGQQS